MAVHAREQILNFKLVKPITDVWSMGATTIYWLLTRQPVRDFPDRTDPLLVILTEPVVPIRRRDARIPDRIAEVIDRAIADELSVAELARAFEAAL